MNDIYKVPLFTSWPTPLSGKDLINCFKIKKNPKKSSAKSKARSKTLSSFINLFSVSY